MRYQNNFPFVPAGVARARWKIYAFAFPSGSCVIEEGDILIESAHSPPASLQSQEVTAYLRPTGRKLTFVHVPRTNQAAWIDASNVSFDKLFIRDGVLTTDSED